MGSSNPSFLKPCKWVRVCIHCSPLNVQHHLWRAGGRQAAFHSHLLDSGEQCLKTDKFPLRKKKCSCLCTSALKIQRLFRDWAIETFWETTWLTAASSSFTSFAPCPSGLKLQWEIGLERFSFRQNIQKALGFAPSRSASKQAGSMWNPDPNKYKWN